VLAEEMIAKSMSPGFDQLQQLRLLPELCAGILIDQHGALAQFLELVANKSPATNSRCCGADRRQSGNALASLGACARGET